MHLAFASQFCELWPEAEHLVQDSFFARHCATVWPSRAHFLHLLTGATKGPTTKVSVSILTVSGNLGKLKMMRTALESVPSRLRSLRIDLAVGRNCNKS